MAPKETYLILIADDHPLISDGLAKLIQGEKQFVLAGIAADGIQAWELYLNTNPDIAILDINMKGLDGIQVTEKIKKYNEQTKVVLFTMHKEPWILARARKSKPNGILLKSQTPQEILTSLKRIVSGEKIIDFEILQILDDCSTDLEPILTLTARETEILKLISQGYTTAKIAEKIFLSVNTIETYRKNLLFKFDTTNVASLIQQAAKFGILKV
jgi:two-component system response regulator NreC